MCNYDDKSVFISGGIGLTERGSTHVYRFNVANESVDQMPHMRDARQNHASCSLGDSIFVFCGFGNTTHLNSIERLQVSPNVATRWDYIHCNPMILEPRRNLAVAPLNKDEICILGGYSKGNFLGDIVLFNTKTKACIKAIDSRKSLMKFDAITNQSAQSQTRQDTVMAYVMNGATEKMQMISYTKGEPTIRHLKKLQ